MDLGFEVKAEIQFTEVKVELGPHAVKTEAAGFAFDAGKDGVKTFVEGVGEIAVPVGEDAVAMGLQGVGKGGHRRGEVMGRLLAETTNPFDQALEAVAGEAFVGHLVDVLEGAADLVGAPGPEGAHVDPLEALFLLVGEVFGVLEIDKAIAAQQGSDLEIRGLVLGTADLIDLVASEFDEVELVEDLDGFGEVFVGSFDVALAHVHRD